jgi:hypothetical protein
MSPYAPGDKSKAICSTCQKLTTTTFVIRDVPYADEEGSGIVRGILAASCDTCSHIVAIPAQSTPAIKAAIEAIRQARH